MYSSRIYLKHLNGHTTGGLKAGRVVHTRNRFYIDVGPNFNSVWVIADVSSTGLKKKLYELLIQVTREFPIAEDVSHNEIIECKPLQDCYIDINDNGELVDFGHISPEKVQKEKEYNMQVYLLVKDYGIF